MATSLLLSGALTIILVLPGAATTRNADTLSAAGGAADARGWGCGPAPDATATPRPTRTHRPVHSPTPDTSLSDSPDPSTAADPGASPGTMDPSASDPPQQGLTPGPKSTPRPRKTPRPTHRPTPEPTAQPTPERTPDATPEPADSQSQEPTAQVALAVVAAPGWDVRPVGRLFDQAAPSPTPTTEGTDALPGWQPFADWLASQAGDLVAAPDSRTPSATSPEPRVAGSASASPSAEPGPPSRARPADDTVDGVDVSHWNGHVRFDLVGAAGGRFVLMKATQGTDIVDAAFRRHLAGALGAGLLVGAYHFYDYRADGTLQADHFIDTLEAAGAVTETLPPIVDVECFQSFGSADQSYVRHQLRAFADRVFERTGRLPMVYTSGLMWRAVTGGAADFGDLPLWIACWRCASPALPPGWADWLFWQTGSTVLDDTGDRLGSDRFAGDARELATLASDARVTAGRSVTRDRTVHVRLAALDGDAARVSLDRRTWTAWLPTRGTVDIRLPDHDGRYRVWIRTRSVDGVRAPTRSAVVVLDRTPPHVDTPLASMAAAVPAAGEPGGLAGPLSATVTTTIRDDRSGVADVTTQVDCGVGWVTTLAEVRSRRADSLMRVRVVVPIASGATCLVRFTAADKAGNHSAATSHSISWLPVSSTHPEDAAGISPSAEPSPAIDPTPP